MATESEIEHDVYLRQLPRWGIPSIVLRDFIFQTFSIIIDFILPTIKTITKNVWSISERALLNPEYSTNFTCDLYKEWGEKLAARTVINVSFNNGQKYTNESVRKEQTVDFKKRQGKKE